MLEVQPLTTETMEWDAFVRSTPQGSPFHLMAWKRAVEATFGHRSHYLMAVRGSTLEGVLPLFETRGLLGGRGLVSVPYGVYGGICATSEEARTTLVDAARTLAKRRGAAYVVLRHRAGQELTLPTKSLYVTFSRPISRVEEENLNAIPRKQRRMTRQGLKHGLRAELGTVPERRVGVTLSGTWRTRPASTWLAGLASALVDQVRWLAGLVALNRISYSPTWSAMSVKPAVSSRVAI